VCPLEYNRQRSQPSCSGDLLRLRATKGGRRRPLDLLDLLVISKYLGQRRSKLEARLPGSVRVSPWSPRNQRFLIVAVLVARRIVLCPLVARIEPSQPSHISRPSFFLLSLVVSHKQNHYCTQSSHIHPILLRNNIQETPVPRVPILSPSLVPSRPRTRSTTTYPSANSFSITTSVGCLPTNNHDPDFPFGVVIIINFARW
jgi:hypothetical protein